MPRTARASIGDICYHVINRGNAHAAVFHDNGDFQMFQALLARAQRRLHVDLFAACLMPNHFHLVIRPLANGDLSRWMQWLLTAHVRKHHKRYDTTGRIWQGRFKAFPVQQDDYLLTVIRYVERNALRANLVEHAEDWPWGSLYWRLRGQAPIELSAPPIDLPADWVERVNQPDYPHEIAALRHSVNKGTPYGNPGWIRQTASKLGLDFSLRDAGRPSKRKMGTF